ncbi:MAG: glycosyltransferase family 39 protein [Chloroflexi bacterium]|nr:glycosyltransferase family 39 protein [Chloroflexota bacterium]
MTEGQGLRYSLQRTVASKLRGWTLIQTLALVAAAVFAYNGARILVAAPRTTEPLLNDYDSAVLWLGLALLALLLAAWRPARPALSPRAWRPAIESLWRDHRLEIALFALIIGAGVFMRFYRFGDTLPPEIGLCCEEHLTGGVAYDALHGQRPVLFPLVRWTAALGFLVFGETTFGLRFFFPVMGVATLVVFYFLLRQLVSVQTALFGLALYAVAWWPALRNRQTTGGTLYAVLFAFFLVRGLKTKNPLMFLAAGVLAGLMSYEYEAYRAVPIIAAGFLGAAALWLVLLRGTNTSSIERALALLKIAWRPALIFFMAAGIVLVPLIVGTAQGKDLYLSSVHRQEDSRGGARLADAWPDQLKWASQLFLPFGPTDYPTSPPREAAGIHLLDPLTAMLAVAGVAAGTVLFYRGLRLWFVSWVVLSLVGGSLLLTEFAPWSFFGLLPVLLLLAALLIDDVRSYIARRFGAAGGRAFTAALIVGIAFSFWWNADTLFNDIATSREIQRVYGDERSFVYAMCSYLNDQGDENFTFAFSNAQKLDGFAAPHETAEEQRRAWGDFIWACHDLDGAALPAAEEAWPLSDIPAGPVTLVFTDPLGPADELIAELNRAYPGLGEPDHLVTGPADTYTLLGYEFASGEVLNRTGLWGDYTVEGSGEIAASRVDPLDGLVWAEPPLPLPFTVRWRGVVRVAEATTARLQVETDDPVSVLLDGQLVYSTAEPESGEDFIDLLPGWHPVEVTLTKQQEGGGVRLVWAEQSGDTKAVAADDLFPLAELDGWIHERSMGLQDNPRQLVSQRLDFAPHLALTSVLKLASPTGESFVTEERWRGFVELTEQTELAFRAEFRAGTVTLLVNGQPFAKAEASARPETLLQTLFTLPAGRHQIELVQELERDTPWSGARLFVGDRFGHPMRVTP